MWRVITCGIADPKLLSRYGRAPVTVAHHAATVDEALHGAVRKLKRLLASGTGPAAEGTTNSIQAQQKGLLVANKHTVKVGRPYDPRKRGDGLRVLVDRIWRRGLSKEKADLDE